MPLVQANAVELYYETRGLDDAPVVLLIMGLGTQMIAWPDAFVDGLVGAGFRVVRYDNRDIGKSQHLDGAHAICPARAFLAKSLGIPFRVAYSLTDMAADAVALIDVLGITSAHVVGASMGGAIGQIVAATWPERVRSLTSIMATSGARGLPGPSLKLRRVLTRKRPTNLTREEAGAMGEEVLRQISYLDDSRAPDAFREAAMAAYDRGTNPDGFRRQLLAIIADGSRADRLPKIAAPTLVIHGAADPLVPLACGEDVARRVPGATLKVIERMAHDLPPSQVDVIVSSIAAHAHAADRGRA